MFGRTVHLLVHQKKKKNKNKKNKDKGQKEGRRRAVLYLNTVIGERERLTKGNAITSKGKEWGKKETLDSVRSRCAPLVVAVLFKRLNYVFLFLSIFSLSLFSYIYFIIHVNFVCVYILGYSRG